ncbi:hypothetical protein BDR06DRAFT_861237, partial [Suillus hirtellus]
LPDVAKYMCVLTMLTMKAADLHFPKRLDEHSQAFDAIKRLITSPQCLTTINHDNPGNNKIFITCNASDYAT